jgi:hypothetical protein
MSLVRNALRLATVLLLAACASGGGTTSAGGNRALLSAEELQTEVGRTLEDVIRQRRPQWLRTRGSTSMDGEAESAVYQDGTRMGGPSFLRTINAEAVESVRYLTPGEATTRFGTGHANGAIVVTTRRR